MQTQEGCKSSRNLAQGHTTTFGPIDYFGQPMWLLRSGNTGFGLPSKSDHIWSCCPPSFKKDNRIWSDYGRLSDEADHLTTQEATFHQRVLEKDYAIAPLRS
jgi:hypothetical protein